MPATETSARRLPAEWEPQSAVQLTFPHQDTDWAEVLDEVLPCFAHIAETISRFEKVLVVCRNIEAAKRLLKNAVQENLLFAECDSNDTWAHGHGGITVFCPPLEGGRGEENKKPLVLDFVFNGWGLKFPADKDNFIARCLYDKGVFNAEIQHGGIVLEDGHRLPATYANFLIINGAVLVPTCRLPQDAEALEVFKSIFPDREIVGIDCRPLILQHGSLHCVTMQ